MQTNNTAIDIFHLIPVSDWSEEQKIELFLQFMDVFIVFVFSDLSDTLPDSAEIELKTLLNDKAPVDQVISFYERLLPHLDDMMYQKALEFKKIFIIKVYEDALDKLEKQVVTHPMAASPIKVAKDIEFWRTLLLHAQHDEWKEIELLLKKSS